MYGLWFWGGFGVGGFGVVWCGFRVSVVVILVCFVCGLVALDVWWFWVVLQGFVFRRLGFLVFWVT